MSPVSFCIVPRRMIIIIDHTLSYVYAKDIYVRQSFLRFWPWRWILFWFYMLTIFIFMTRAATLPQRVNRNSERFTRYEPENMITFLRKWYRGPKSLGAHKIKRGGLWGKLGDTGLFFFSLLSLFLGFIWLFCRDLKNYTQCNKKWHFNLCQTSLILVKMKKIHLFLLTDGNCAEAKRIQNQLIAT